MKLCIVKPDGTVAEILLRDRQPSFEAFNNEQLFFENYQYKFILREIEEYENVEIFVGDYSVPIHYKASTDWYETDQDLVFGGCFDLAYISVWVSEKEGKEERFYTDFLRIATTKQTTRQWFEAGDYTFDHLNYLFKLKTLSRIFEYYCLIKIQNAIALCGFILQDSDRIIYDVEDDSENINNQYIFEGNGYEITLLYEPSIWIDRSNACTNLYSTGYNFIKSKWNDRWTPDFVLKISGNYKDYYYILDAKYSNFYNVKRRYIPALVLKYGTQIASKDKFFSDVIGIGAIYPSKEDKIYYFKKNAINSLKHSLPQYFSLTMVDGDVGTQILKEQIEKLFKVVDILEEECENIDSSKKEMSLNNFEIEHEKIENEPKTEVEKKEKNDSLNINVSGKNCFYYAKNICLCQKKPCTVINAPCKHYIPKKSRELLKEDSCRNLIQYVKRNKPNGRVECSISGLPGCIGAEQCKFYLKKNVHK